MKKLAFPPIALMVLALSLGAVPHDKPVLPERYQRWLNEEVVYIITPVEKEVFQTLQTDRERDLFIEAFWRHRDPTPETPENEFKAEHARRIEYANRYLGRDAPFPGWKTDRGRMYIILGEPRDIQKFESRTDIRDCLVWFYQGGVEQGLPSGFYLLFFKEKGLGTYRLYSPLRDGPQALLTSYDGDPADYTQAYDTLTRINPVLADISMGLVPGERRGLLSRPDMGSDVLIQKINALPSRQVEDQYARKFLEYRDRVEVEYSANYLDSDCLIKVVRGPAGSYFVHYAIEPKRLAVGQYESKNYTTLRINGRVTTPEGRLVYQYEKAVPIAMPEGRMAELSRSPFDLQDAFPLVAGDYKLSLLVKNEVSKEFMSAERSLRIPPDGPSIQLTQPVLGFQATRPEGPQKKIKAFRVGPYQLFCQPGRIFTAGDKLAVAFQVSGLSESLARSARIALTFLKDDQPFREIVRTPAELPDLPAVLEEVPLADFPPAHYRIRVGLSDGGTEIVSATEEFDLTFAPSVGRPWTSAPVLPDADDPIYDRIRGAQLFNLGRYAEARAAHERAVLANPDSADAACGLAQTCLVLGDPRAAVELLAPFLARTQEIRYDMLMLAAEAYEKSGDFAAAIGVLERAVSRYGVNAAAMNAIGEAYLGLGKTAEALAAFEKSLQLSPDQPSVSRRIDELKKRK